MKFRSIVLAALAAVVIDAAAAPPTSQPARVARAADLRDAPTADSKVLLAIPADTAVSVQARSGGWYKVRTDGGEGWVRLSAIRFATASGDSRGGLSAPLRILQTGRAAVTTGTVTTGVRGLTEAELQAATADPAAVAQLDRWAVGPTDAEAFAKQANLQASAVAELPAPDEPARRRR
jgi:uncharacterized protein YgiM (DUF1202 family)